MFNSGDLDYVDHAIAPDAVDHQEPAGTDFRAHLKEVITVLRSEFPDLRFELHEILADEHTVACRSTMTGTWVTLLLARQLGAPAPDLRVGIAA